MFFAIAYLFVLIGYYFILKNKILDKNYIGLLMFFTLKVIFDYRKCTVSYMECKLRGVKKDQGYLYRFLNGIVDLRYTDHYPVLFTMVSILYYYQYIIKKQKLNII
jgi:hypothetical protein